MKKLPWSRIVATVWIAGWLFFLMVVQGACFEGLSHHLGWAYSDMALPALTESFAIPVIGGLSHTVPRQGITWVTCVVWTVLYGWPVGTLVAIWRIKAADSANWVFFYSVVGYGILFLTIAAWTAVGLWLPFSF